ncbi:Acetyltransferase (isoleucine patch superfamily) [Acinetobacter marinus]|uniref:Acetyltransferase (Isoleucine patch superfamily) n=1 Tax=Acinetobacter marinus TaxID=281375 RepID=A0A1G6IJ92_9GAMM|nr:sugar O-acetyltransferase [Acinetobacter marinus]SDC06662.1 Acetyltransferase (isoleucine patch superfamily) [Acinetobacter marinus]
MSKDIFERLRSGDTIRPNDPEGHKMLEASFQTIAVMQKLNTSSEPEQIRTYLSEMIGQQIHESTTLFPPLQINCGKHLSLGKNVFINFNCTMLSLGGIRIDDDVLIAPNVSLLTEGHPLDPTQRHSLVPKPIHIKRNVWIGAGATILQGVTIGENSVVAAHAVVSQDVPDHVVVAGTPAKVIKHLDQG